MLPLKNEFQYFLSACEYLNFSHAAVSLDIQQASVSKAIKKLEDQYGKKLFIRKARTLKITEFGLILQRQLIKHEEMWSKEFFELMEEYDSISGKIKLGIHETVAINSLGETLSRLNEINEELFVDIMFDNSLEVIRKVARGDYDIGVAVTTPGQSDIFITPLQKEFVATSSAKNKPKEVLYYNPEMVGLVKHLKQYSKYKKVPVASYELMAEMSKTSHGIFLLPNPVASRVGILKQCDYSSSSDFQLSLIYRYDRPKTKAFEAVIKMIKEEFTSH